MLGRAFACSGASDSLRSAKPSFAAENVFRSSGAPGRFRAARPVVMNSRNSLPALNAMPVVQVLRPYSVSGADGRSRHSDNGKYRANNASPLQNATFCAQRTIHSYPFASQVFGNPNLSDAEKALMTSIMS